MTQHIISNLNESFNLFFAASDAMKKAFDESAMTPEEEAHHNKSWLEVQRIQREQILEENARLDAELEKELEACGYRVQAVPILTNPTPIPKSIQQIIAIDDGDDCLQVDDDLSDPLPEL